MTDTQPMQPVPQPPAPAAPHLVSATPDTRLGQLHAEYAAAKASADAASARLKAVVDGIKLELTQAAPGERSVELVGNNYAAPALQLQYIESWRIDAGKLKAADPETYVRYAKKSGSWRLAAVKGAGAGEQS